MRSVPTSVPDHKHGGHGANAPLSPYDLLSYIDQLRTAMQEMSERFNVRHTASA